MLRRKATLDPTQKQRKNRQVQVLAILDMCLQIPHEDRLLLRNRIKQDDKEIISHLVKCKKDKNFHHLQIQLRKSLQVIKGNSKFNIIQHLRSSSSAKRSRTPISMKKKNTMTQSSYPTSVQNSHHSSPKAQVPAKASITLNHPDLQRKIENQIDQEIKNALKSQQIVMPCRGITPRYEEEESSQIMIQRNVVTDTSYELKDMLKNKIISKTKKSEKIDKENKPPQPSYAKRIKQNIDEVTTLRNPMYGEFSKRIRMVIDQSYR